jgi:hypothetical protein
MVIAVLFLFSCEDTLGTDPDVVKTKIGNDDGGNGGNEDPFVELPSFSWEVMETFENPQGHFDYYWTNIHIAESYCFVDSSKKNQQPYILEIDVTNTLNVNAINERYDRIKKINIKLDTLQSGRDYHLNEENPNITCEIYNEIIDENQTYLLDRHLDYFATFHLNYDPGNNSYYAELFVEFLEESVISTRSLRIVFEGSI